MTAMLRRRLAVVGTLVVAGACAPVAAAALPSVSTAVVTTPLANLGAHRGLTVSAACAAGSRLVGGGGYLRPVSDPAALPTNGLVLGGTTASTGSSPVDLAAGDGAVDPASWLSIANYTGVSEAGNQASTFALCATADGPAHVMVKTASRTGIVATQEVQPPAAATATCPVGTRLIGGGATTSTPDQVNDGLTVGNNGNLKPLGDYPSDAAGASAADGSTSATSWSAYGSAGISAATDTVTAYALCSTDPATPPVQVARTDVDGPDAQLGTTVTTASATCPAGTRMLGGGYGVDETVAGTGSGLQPQQGYHMRGSYPSTPGTPPAAVSDATANPDTWTALVQAGGQNLAVGKHMTTRAYVLCATEPPPPDNADVSLALADAPDPVTVGDTLTYTLTVANGGPADATAVALSQTLPASTTYTSATTTAGSCTQASGTVSCALGTIPSAGSATITVTVAAAAVGTLTSSATVSSAVADPRPANNDATATTVAQLAQRATPAIGGQAPAAATLGATIADTATLTGGTAPTGTLTFDLYGPGDSACASPLASSTATVSGNGSYTSASFTTTATGTYRWIARYGGDPSNEPAATACDDPRQTVSVKAAPALTAQASAGATAGGTISATATLTGGTLLTGTMTFRLYGPGDDGCATPLRTSTAAVSGNGIYAAPAFTAAAPGTYRWVADYGGDANNRAAGPTSCTDPRAAVVVDAAPAAPTPPPPGPTAPSSPTPSPQAPSNAFSIVRSRADSQGRIKVTLKSPGRGTFKATATARRGRVRFAFGSRSTTVRGRATTVLTIVPGTRARRELRRRNLRVAVAISFRPTGGRQRTRTTELTVKHRRAG
jgi:uncharacterized repeat protein (TIGR01451 family)